MALVETVMSQVGFTILPVILRTICERASAKGVWFPFFGSSYNMSSTPSSLSSTYAETRNYGNYVNYIYIWFSTPASCEGWLCLHVNTSNSSVLETPLLIIIPLHLGLIQAWRRRRKRVELSFCWSLSSGVISKDCELPRNSPLQVNIYNISYSLDHGYSYLFPTGNRKICIDAYTSEHTDKNISLISCWR